MCTCVFVRERKVERERVLILANLWRRNLTCLSLINILILRGEGRNFAKKNVPTFSQMYMLLTSYTHLIIFCIHGLKKPIILSPHFTFAN